MRCARPHGLVFDGRVPPRVDDDHVVGRGQVQAEAAGLQADQEQVALAAPGRRRRAGCARPPGCCRRGTGSCMPGSVEPLAQQRQEVGELAEHQRLVAAGHQLVREALELLHLGADQAEFGRHQARVAGGAAQPRQRGQHVELRPGRCAIVRLPSAWPRCLEPAARSGFEQGALLGAGHDTRGRSRCAAAGRAAPRPWCGAAGRATAAGAAGARAGVVAVALDRRRRSARGTARAAQQAGVEQVMIDHSSPRRFSTGVPVSASRKSALQRADGLGALRGRRS